MKQKEGKVKDMAEDIEKKLQSQYERWKDYANALLVAFSILFVGTAIIGVEEGFPRASLTCGIAATVLVVVWHAKERTNLKWPIGDKPLFLFAASGLIGAQVALLLISLW